MSTQHWCSLPHSQYTHTANVVPVFWWKGFIFVPTGSVTTKSTIAVSEPTCYFFGSLVLFWLFKKNGIFQKFLYETRVIFFFLYPDTVWKIHQVSQNVPFFWGGINVYICLDFFFFFFFFTYNDSDDTDARDVEITVSGKKKKKNYPNTAGNVEKPQKDTHKN